MHLRKEVTLNEIDDIIKQVQDDSDVLVKAAAEVAAKLAEEQRLRDIRETVRKLATKRLEFKHRTTNKRQNSFKFRDREPLLAT